jgi:hypothetical protein
MRTNKLLAILAVSLMVSVPVFATDWHYLGKYPDKKSRDYVSFYDPASVERYGTTDASALVRSVWAKDLDAYWKKHGGDADIIDAGAERVSNLDYPEYFSLPAVIKKFPEKELQNISIIAMGNEFIVKSGRVTSRVDIRWDIDCKQRRFANIATTVYLPSGRVGKAIKPNEPEYLTIESGTEMDYLRLLLCKRML